MVRDKIPCSDCGGNHQTRQHGKTDNQIYAESASRAKNPLDPIKK